MEINGYKIEHRSGGLYPQLAGWWACPLDDPEHKRCVQNDTRDEAIQWCEKHPIHHDFYKKIASLESELTRLREENERLKSHHNAHQKRAEKRDRQSDEEITRLREENERQRLYIEDCPPFAMRAGQRMADEINRLVIERVIDSRSAAADASLYWKNPDRNRLDEIDHLRAAIQSEIRELRAIAVSLERGGGDAWRTREKIRAWEEVLGDG